MAARDAGLAHAIAHAVKSFNADLIMYGLSGSFLISQAKEFGLKTASEVFADRTYTAEGTLTPRSQHNAMIENSVQAIDQVLLMIKRGIVIATDGQEVPLEAETICIHGDGPNAVELVKGIRTKIEKEGIKVCPINR
jgi:UPF0271 protein